MLKSHYTDQSFIRVTVFFTGPDGKSIMFKTRWPSNTKVFTKVMRLRCMCKRLECTNFKIRLDSCGAETAMQNLHTKAGEYNEQLHRTLRQWKKARQGLKI